MLSNIKKGFTGKIFFGRGEGGRERQWFFKPAKIFNKTWGTKTFSNSFRGGKQRGGGATTFYFSFF